MNFIKISCSRFRLGASVGVQTHIHRRFVTGIKYQSNRNMAERLDVIIFGATGFTGKYTIPPVERLGKENGRTLTWGVAGRSEAKLEQVLNEMSTKIGKDLATVPKIVADVADEESLIKMTAQAKVIINTCGPYRFFGEPVIKACLETGTHHVDVSGEPQYMETMQLKYHKVAKEKGVYIISACGFDSIPCDLGVVFLQQNFKGTVNSVDTYLNGKEVGGPRPGASGNYGTWQSAVHALANSDESKEIRAKLFPQKLPKFLPKVPSRGFMHKNKEINNSWSLPFFGPDQSVVQRTQRHFYYHEKKRPVQIHTYFCVGSILNVMVLAIVGTIFGLMTKFKLGQKLLLDHPKIFSFGYFSREGPSEEKMNNKKFSITLIGEGWSKTQEDCHEEFTSKPDKKLIAKVRGTNPGYGATTVALTLSAIKILEESSKMPNEGGVYSPGAAFAHTSLIEELNKNGLTYEICEDGKDK